MSPGSLKETMSHLIPYLSHQQLTSTFLGGRVPNFVAQWVSSFGQLGFLGKGSNSFKLNQQTEPTRKGCRFFWIPMGIHIRKLTRLEVQEPAAGGGSAPGTALPADARGEDRGGGRPRRMEGIRIRIWVSFFSFCSRPHQGSCWEAFYIFAYGGLVVEIQPLLCQNSNCCSPSNVNQVTGLDPKWSFTWGIGPRPYLSLVHCRKPGWIPPPGR